MKILVGIVSVVTNLILWGLELYLIWVIASYDSPKWWYLFPILLVIPIIFATLIVLDLRFGVKLPIEQFIQFSP
jgi:hypothetical protein